jgi:diacylglycerol kinase
MEGGGVEISWRARRRSRVAEISDGCFMLLSDVAVIRTIAVVAVMFVVAFLSRKHSTLTSALTIAACFYLLCELFNTVVETIVDRISLEANVLSARIKHASAFISALAGGTSFVLLFVVLYQVFMNPKPHSTTQHAQTTHVHPTPPAHSAPPPAQIPPMADAPSAPSEPHPLPSAPITYTPSTQAQLPPPRAAPTATPSRTIIHPLLWNQRIDRRRRYARYKTFKFRNRHIAL